MLRIAVDAMGGDQAPGPELDAVVAALRERRDLGILLVGDEAQLADGIARRGASSFLGERLALRHASQVIRMDDAPSSAVRTKKDSSMRVAFDAVRAGDAQGVVSAGHSGAMLACGLFVLKRLRGTIRPVIVTTFPTLSGACVLCDMGANVDVKPLMLAQFGLLGAVYAQVALGKERPRVALLSNGEEESKGTDLTREAHAILRRVADAEGAPFRYTGYVEGRHIFTGDVDVVATDGFTGNVVLKTAEGAAGAVIDFLKRAFRSSRLARLGGLLARPALSQFKRQIDYAETGGALLLGVDGVAMVCHGRSPPQALKNAIFGAARFAEKGIVARLAATLAATESVWDAAAEDKDEKEPKAG